jgi:DNA-binding transcriptional LysR family regulator
VDHGDIGIFIAVVEHGSFTAAGQALGLSTAQVSRRLKALEDDLGVRLLERTTRRVRATDAGQAYRDRVAPLLDGLAEAAREAAQLRAEPRGTLRLALPTAFGRQYLVEPIAAFAERWPDLEVEASFSDRTVDLVAEGFDLAIRGAARVTDNLIVRRLLDFRGVAVASPSYLARRGVPASPQDLVGHACLVNAGLRTMPGWTFFEGGEAMRIDVSGPIRFDDGDALVAAAAAGAGIAYEPDFLAASALQRGDVVRILDDATPYTGHIYAVYPNRRFLPAKVRLFIDHLAETWAAPPWTACPRVERR